MTDQRPRCVEELLEQIRLWQEDFEAQREMHLLVDFGGMNAITSLRGRPVVDVVVSL
jgi:hypothetical protein